MLAEIEKLLVLQDRDLRLLALRKDLERIPLEEEGARSRLAGDEKRLADAREALRENEVAIKNFELDTETRRTTIARLKTQQFETRKNEEFAAISNEIERYTEEISKLEDEELELMEKGDQLRAAIKEAETKLAATQKLVDEELAALGKKKEAARTQVSEVENERKSQAKRIDSGALSLYERILKKKGDRAVVPLPADSGMCGGCHMKLTTATMHDVKAEKQITHCENCGRMLYLDEG